MGIVVKDGQIYTNSGTDITLASGTKIVATNSWTDVPYQSGQIITMQHFQSTSRTSLSGTSSITLWNAGTFNKKITNSTLYIFGQLPFAAGNSYNMGYWWQIGSSGLRRDSIFQKHWNSDQIDSSAWKVLWTINGQYSTTDTGGMPVSIGHASINGGADRPGDTWNPNSSDDAAGGQTSSDLIVMEVVN